MKKIILYITILMFAVVQIANSQTATLQTKDGTYGTTQLNVSFSGFSAPVGAVTMKIGFDPNVATFTGITHGTITSGIIANAVGNEIVIAWSNVPGVSVNGIGFKLNFIYSGGSCDLTFNQGCEIADGSGNVIQATLLNGAINQPSLSTTATIGSQNGDYSLVNELPLSFSGFPTTPADALVGAISLNIAYDNTKLQFVGINGLTGAIANAANGIITIQWSNATPININTLNLKLKFNYLGGYSAVSFSGVNIISNSNGVQIPVSMFNGSINQPATSAIVDLGNANGNLSGSTVIPVNFSGFPANPAALTLNIAYDNTVANFIGTSGLAGLSSSASNGVITLAWSNQNGVAISSFNLLFNYIGGSGSLNFTGQNEIANVNGAIIPVTYTGGNINQPPTPVNVSLGNVSFTANPVLVPLEFSGITGNINSTSMFVGFDQTKLTFIGTENLSKTGIIVNQDYSTGKILINWADANPANTITNGKFLDLKFTFTGGVGNTNVPVYFTTFNSSSNSLSDDLGNTVLANFTNGNVNYVPPITTFNVTGGGSYCAGGPGVFASLDGSQLGVTYQLKLDGVNYGPSFPGTGSAIGGPLTVAGTYTVDATMGLTTIAMTGSAVVTVNPLPNVTANTTASEVCLGGTVTLTGGGAVSYVWDNSVTDGLAFAPAATNTYTVIGTDGNGCENTANVAVTVNALPIVTANTSATEVCLGGTVTLTGGGAVSYVWDNSVTDGLAFAPAATNTYTVIGTDGNGCENTANVAVTVNALPIVTANTSATEVCLGGTVTLTGGGAVSYVWDNSVTDGLAFAPAATNTYTVIGTDGNGCENTANVAVTVNALPIVTANTSATEVCLGGTVTLTGGGAVSYVWDNSVTDGLAFDPTATNTYTVIGTDGNGCENTANVTVTVNPRPTAVITGNQSINNGNSALLTLTVTGTGTISGTLSDGSPFSGTAPTINVSVSPLVATSYTIATLSDDNCTSLPGDLSGTANITVLYKVSGILEYNNDPSPRIPLVGFTVNLKDGLVTVGTTTTDVNGYYELWTSNGTYSLDVITAPGAYYYSDFDDVLALYDYIVSGTPIPEENSLRLLACDVDLNNDINFDDVMALYELVTTGSSPAFTAPEFIYETPAIIVNSLNLNQNILGICSGNILGSNTSPNP